MKGFLYLTGEGESYKTKYEKAIDLGKSKILEFEFYVFWSSPVDRMLYRKAVSKHVGLMYSFKMPTLVSISRWIIKSKLTSVRLN